jgi:radical SAM protein with 4Fe4S-binding SPASM domain
LRFTITKSNYQQLDELFKLIEQEEIPRICFYHLVYSGRGKNIKSAELSSVQKKQVIDQIIAWTKYFINHDNPKEILTVDNHADGPYLYLKLKDQFPSQAAYVYQQLLLSGGNRSGSAIANIDHQGNVYADQFSRFIVLGNIRDKNFAEIWTDQDNNFLNKLRHRQQYLQGKCENCNFLAVCNGNLRARAYAAGDLWGEDPGCYLSEAEIKTKIFN